MPEELQEENTEEIVAVEEQTVNEEETPQEQPESDRDYAAEAEGMGWIPKERFKGDPERWTDAKTFVERGENFIPFIKANNEKLKEQLEQDKADFAKRIARMEAAQSRREAAQAKQYEQRLADVKAAQTRAMRDGDEAEYLRLDQERDELQQEAAETKGPDNATVQQEWMATNTWYNENFDMAHTADQYSQFIARRNPSMSMADNLAKVDEHIRQKFPEAFGIEEAKPKPKPKQAVDGGSSFQASPFKKTAKGYSALPAEAKEMCQRDIADGLYKDQAEWAKDYFNG